VQCFVVGAIESALCNDTHILDAISTFLINAEILCRQVQILTCVVVVVLCVSSRKSSNYHVSENLPRSGELRYDNMGVVAAIGKI